MTTLGSLCELIIDCEHRTAPTVAHGYPLIRTPDIGVGYLDFDGAQRVDEDTYKAWTKRAVPRAGDLILAREAPVGNVGIVPPGVQPVLGQRTVLIRPRADALDPYYLNYLLSGPDLRGWMQGVSVGATVPHLNMADIRSMPLPPIPPMATQRKIAGILAAYDRLIDNNRRRRMILEEMSRRIYREWFVDFRYPGRESLRLVDSELGPLPQGWSARTIGDIAAPERYSVTSGPFGSKLGTKDYVSCGIPVIRGTNLALGGGFRDDGFVFVTEEKADTMPSCEARPGDVIVTQRGTLGQVGLIPASARFDRYIISQSQMKVTVNPHEGTAEYLYAALRSFEVTERLQNHAITAGVPHINLSLLRQFLVVWPDRNLQARWTDCVRELDQQLEILTRATDVARVTRDRLLAPLVTGRVDVTGLDIALNEAVA